MEISRKGSLVRIESTNYEFDDDTEAEGFLQCVKDGGDIKICAKRHSCKRTFPFQPPDKPQS
jgi:hypothetical protein